MDTAPIKLLLVQQDPELAQWLQQLLQESASFDFTCKTIATLHEYKEMAEPEYDVVLLDLPGTDLSRIETYSYANTLFPLTPIVVLTDSPEDQPMLDITKLGVQDYISKKTLDGRTLVYAIRYARERKKLELQKDEFLGFASHELKTPVTSIKSYTQLIELQAVTTPSLPACKLLPLVFKVDAQVTKLTYLINELLDVTKVQAGKLDFHFEPFLIDQLVEEVIESMQMTTQRHTIERSGATGAYVNGDKERTLQVLVNLLSNAIKYSPQADRISVALSNGDGKVAIAIQDYGIGINPENQARIFERFFRVNDHQKETYPGLGLGLYIASEITKRQNGKLLVESTEGEGSTFLLELPVVYHQEMPAH